MKIATESGFRKRLEPSLQLSFFAVKSSMVDVRLGSKYAAEYYMSFQAALSFP